MEGNLYYDIGIYGIVVQTMLLSFAFNVYGIKLYLDLKDIQDDSCGKNRCCFFVKLELFQFNLTSLIR